MATVAGILAELKKKGKANYQAIYERHGIPKERSFGVLVSELKKIQKTIKGDQALAMELYKTGKMEPMYLAGLVADGAKMSKKELQAWAEGSHGMPMISEYTVPWVATENEAARELALEWMKSKKESVAASGWFTYAGYVSTQPDEKLDLEEIRGLMRRAVKEINGAPNRVKYTMNGFVISVGGYVKPLLKEAKAIAKELGKVEVDVGETECKVPFALEYIEKIEKMGRIGKKKKTMKC
ncbi:MAG TPA: DNA alkylation repair protein [Candidatus Dormibacteraeota bacterium]|jgi:3-methyladenine DNA glycosylase AlkD|nr:DNA alkylation repair protein [Candidatus Dormibacteraeota bacterium]